MPLRRRGGVAGKVTRSSKAHDRSHLVAVAVAIEVLQPKGFGCVRLRRIASPTIDALLRFVHEHVRPGATVRTDGSPIYARLQGEGFDH